MSNCIKCGAKLDIEGILCDKCRGEMMGFSSSSEDKSMKEDIIEVRVQSAKEEKPVAAKPVEAEKPPLKKMKKKKVHEGPKKSDAEIQKEQYAKLMVEYEESKKKHETKQAQERQTQPQEQPQPYYDPYTGQYYQYPPQGYPNQNQQPSQDQYQQQGYPVASQQPLDPANSKVCPRCGTMNERWRLSCANCKSKLG